MVVLSDRRYILTYTVREVVPYINWIYYFHAWGMEPRFAAVADVHACPACRAAWVGTFPTEEQPKAREAMKLYGEATAQLGLWADEAVCRAVFLLADAYSTGDDIVIGGKVRIPLLRQQRPDRAGYTWCLSDFIREARSSSSQEMGDMDIANRIGVFASTADPVIDSQRSIVGALLADRLAEATAERMHEEVRKRYWGYAKDEALTMRELHEECFQGIRPAVGYPSLPDQSVNFLIDELLQLNEIGITLSENGAMNPHGSVSGFMFAHPQARYFSVGKISEEQLKDYSSRRGLDTKILRNFLAANL